MGVSGLQQWQQSQHPPDRVSIEYEDMTKLESPRYMTLAAMTEVKSGAELDELTDENIDNLEDYIKSL